MDNNFAESSQIQDQKKRRNSKKRLLQAQSICSGLSDLTGIPSTMIDRSGRIFFRSHAPLSEAAQDGMRIIRKWVVTRIHRRKEQKTALPAPGPLIFDVETDRLWAAVSLNRATWSQDILLFGPARPDQAEGILQTMTEIFCHSFHSRSSITSYYNRSTAVKPVTGPVRNLRQSHKPMSPATDSKAQCLMAISHGDPAKLQKAFAAFIEQWPQKSPDNLRRIKNEAILFAQQSITAAGKSALDEEMTFGILYDWLDSLESCGSNEDVYTWLKTLFTELTDQVVLTQKEAWTQPVRLCQHYIRRRVYSKITLDDLARYTGHNASYLSRQFKTETGESISSFILKTKIEAACELLKTYKKPIQDVAIMLAFSDQAHFTRAFRQFTGTTPLKFIKDN